MRVSHVAGGVLLAVAAGGIGFAVLAWRSEIDPVDPPGRAAFEPADIAQGAKLAALGNCLQCHTAPGGKPFAGGYPLETPFGTIHGTNITPDPETGIGSWSEQAFQRAMAEGVGRSGEHLYPGFPYDHFTKVTARDNRALYAYLMTREPVRAEAPPNRLPWPLTFRPLLAGWKLLFLETGEYRPDPERSDEWNRGAYLAEGLSHCGACHTPRNALGARETDREFAGGFSEGWHAPALNRDSTAPVPWTRDALFDYLRTGISEDHAVASGPMAPVVRNLSDVPDADVRAIATYVADRMGAPDGPPPEPVASVGQEERGQEHSRAATIYAGACATCHEPGGPLQFQAPVALDRATSLAQPNPSNAIRAILHGVETPDAAAQPLMPGFANALTDAQVAELTAWLRTRFSGGPAWDGLEAKVAEARSGRSAE
ncbi:cytochrome c (plasmid) [Skermanella rosea]|uniref:c-type cytochrome n=1 Tax=Skermanella rosea TaxID=1817965 RepID=UPI0019339810|nr:cytochrome c [Skermanella rosea]UEM06940.1 cytochrome c [Skermanella rosea]